MPILNPEPNLYPETLLDGPLSEAAERQWWVLHTKPRQEKAVSRELLRYRIPFYLPLVEKKLFRRGRRYSSYSPLFGGYVFLYASDEERVRSLKTNRVARVLEVADAEQLVRDLRQLRQLIASNAPLTVESRLTPGDRVRVRQGPLAGLEGTVLRRRAQMRLLVAVNFLQQGASVEIEDFLLEKLDGG